MILVLSPLLPTYSIARTSHTWGTPLHLLLLLLLLPPDITNTTTTTITITIPYQVPLFNLPLACANENRRISRYSAMQSTPAIFVYP